MVRTAFDVRVCGENATDLISVRYLLKNRTDLPAAAFDDLHISGKTFQPPFRKAKSIAEIKPMSAEPPEIQSNLCLDCP